MLTGLTGYVYSVPDNRATFFYSDIVQTSSSEPELTKTIIYPNPAKDYIIISRGSNQNEMHLAIYDINGKMINKINARNNSGISISHLTKGIYLVKLTEKKKIIYTGKLIIQ